MELFKWQLEYGDKIELFQNLQAQGRATPLDEHVPITDTAMWFMEVFQLVGRQRIIGGMSVGPIPPSAMYEYNDRFDLIGSLEEFIAVICAMDDIYLKHISDEKQKAQKRAESQQNRRR